jgi:hypothetical protein
MPFREGYIQMAFFPKSPKTGTFVVLKLWTFIFSSNQVCFEHVKGISYSPLKYLSNGVFHTPIEDNSTPNLREFVVRNKIPNLTPDLIHHNSCIFGLNEQCKGTLNFYTSRNFQWYHAGPIECFFAFSTKALNI